MCVAITSLIVSIAKSPVWLSRDRIRSCCQDSYKGFAQESVELMFQWNEPFFFCVAGTLFVVACLLCCFCCCMLVVLFLLLHACCVVSVVACLLCCFCCCMLVVLFLLLHACCVAVSVVPTNHGTNHCHYSVGFGCDLLYQHISYNRCSKGISVKWV